MNMKYYVEFKRVAFLEIEVEAEDANAAEDLAWAELDKDPANIDKEWYVNQIHKEQ
jgi:hypothetical protein